MKKIIFSVAILSSSILSANLNQLRSLESSFKQTIINDKNSRIIYHGKMFATKNSNKALWEYKKPVEKRIYYNNGKIVIIEPELEQAIFAKLSKVPNILTLLNRAKHISNNQLVTTFNKIKYTITTNGNKIKSISYTDEVHNRVNIEFNNQKVNYKINPSTFNYKIPEDYDILQE